jgi:hypothetical protein
VLVDDREKSFNRGALHGGREFCALQFGEQYVQDVEVAVAQVDRGAFVAVEIHERGRVSGALAFEVVGIFCGRRDQGYERVDAFERVVAHQTPLRDDVMAATRAARQQLDEIEALTIDALVRVRPVIRDDDERGFRRLRRLLDRRPDAPEGAVEFLQGDEVRFAVAVVMRGVVEVARVEVEITNARVFQLFQHLAFKLLHHDVARFKFHQPLVEQLARRARQEAIFEAAFERRPACAALVELKADEAFVVRIRIDEERDAEFVQQFGAGHVHAHLARRAEPEGNEVEVIVGVEREPVELHVALNLQVLARIEERPRRRGEAHPAHVEVFEARAPLIKNMFEPRQQTLARTRIALAHKAFDHVLR